MKAKILIVEDEFVIALHLKGILEQENYTVTTNVASVKQAISLIETTTFDLVLIDINLQYQDDGVQLGHYLLAKDKIPYLYITSNIDLVTLDRAKETRPHGYITKPYKPIDIKSAVAVVLHNFYHKKLDPIRNDAVLINDLPFRMKVVVNFIETNCHRKIELLELIALTKWQKSHFIKTFQSFFNTTPHQYILKTKTEKAALLLIETMQPISEIAIDLGFGSYGSFRLAFKKHFSNITPEQYRLNKQK